MDVMQLTNKQVEVGVQHILNQAGSRGIKVDTEVLYQAEEDLLKAMGDKLNVIMNYGGPDAPGSRKKMAAFLFDDLKLPETPKRSVAKEHLQNFDHPVLDAYFAWTKASRTLSLIRAMYGFINDGRVTTVWQGTNDTSGRIYCKDFNIQQLPVPGRRGLVADEGMVMFLGDYMQFELRCLAALCQDPNLLDAIAQSDPLQGLAGTMLGVPYDKVTHAQRERGKIFFYGLIYGMDANGLSRRLNCTQQMAQDLIDAFFESMPGVKRYIARIHNQYTQTGSVINDFGHIRHIIPKSLNKADIQKALRQAFNTEIQGTTASLLKRAIIRLALIELIEFLATVHDSGLVQFPKEHIEFMVPAIKEQMEFTYKDVHFPIKFATEHSWGDAQIALDPTSDEEPDEAT